MSQLASFIHRTGRLPRLQVRPLRAGEGGAPLPVPQSAGEPRLHEGRPEGARAAVAGAETQTCLRGASLQTCVLRGLKKSLNVVTLCFYVCLFFGVCFSFHLSWLTAAAAAAASTLVLRQCCTSCLYVFCCVGLCWFLVLFSPQTLFFSYPAPHMIQVQPT